MRILVRINVFFQVFLEVGLVWDIYYVFILKYVINDVFFSLEEIILVCLDKNIFVFQFQLVKFIYFN